MKWNRGQRTRQRAPSIIPLNEQRAATQHRLILINGDVWHSGARQQINKRAINLGPEYTIYPKGIEKNNKDSLLIQSC